VNTVWEALKNPVIYTTGATALVALAAFLYTVWQDHRRLRIRVEPLHWNHAPVDLAGPNFRVVCFIRITAFNPGRTPNRITSLTAWRDGEAVPAERGMFQPVDIGPGAWVESDVHVAVFDSVPDPKQAYEGVCVIELAVKALRGYRRTPFDAKAFRPPD